VWQLRMSCLVLLSLGFCAFHGCDKAANRKNPTPEEARTALIEMVEEYEKNFPLSKETAESLKSKKAINELKNAKIYRELDHTMIGPWICDLSDNRFSTTVKKTRAYVTHMYGRFELGTDGRWKAIPDASDIADFGPR